MHSLIQRKPTTAIDDFFNDDFFRNCGTPFWNENEWDVTKLWPRADVYETETTVVYQLEVPGLKKEDIKVTLTGNTLSITAERKAAVDQKGRTYAIKECEHQTTYRSFILPKHVDPKSITATYKDGILVLTLAKAKESTPDSVAVQII